MILSSIIYYSTIFKRRREYKKTIESIGEVTVWTERRFKEILKKHMNFELNAAMLWGIATFLEVIGYIYIYDFLNRT